MKQFSTCLFRIIFGLFLLGAQSGNLLAQDFMMQGWYWDYPKACPSSCSASQAWATVLQNKATELKNAGFTYVWLPPMTRSSFGCCSNGYDPKDLFDLGEFGQGPTGLGTRTQVNSLISAFSANNIKSVADVVYNHRDGGRAEVNSAVEGWIENYNCTKHNAGDNAYPSDRVRFILPLGGSSGNGAGTYYFKIRSASKHPDYYGKTYKFYAETNKVKFQGLTAQTESEPNGGGDCGQGNNTVQLGRDMNASIDNVGSCSGGCGIDEFALTLTTNDFNSTDTLYIYLTNTGSGGYSDHYISGLWSTGAGADIQNQIKYQTYTDFTAMPSGRGGMNYLNFKPNGNPTQLAGDWDWMWFFYDYDQGVTGTRDTLRSWSKWLWTDVGIRGFRMDAVKHFPPSFTGELMNYLNANSINPGMVVGEFFDSNEGTLNGWLNSVYASMNAAAKDSINVRLFDFGLREALKNACDLFGYDVRNVFSRGIVDNQNASPFRVVTFVNNHDFRDAGQPIQNDPMLAYSYILTNNRVGLPCVYYPDYYGVSIPNAPVVNLKAQIDQLIQAHKLYIFGSTGATYLSKSGSGYPQVFRSGYPTTSLIYQLSGNGTPQNRDVIVAINFAGDTMDVDQKINLATVPAGSVFTDIIRGGFTTLKVDTLTIKIPPRSYSVWVEGVVSPLSVDWLSFNAVPDGAAVKLNWSVAVETNLSHYEIERSADGRQFDRIATVKPLNAKQPEKNYEQTDLPGLAGIPLYYRLKAVMQDGSSEYSPVRVVQFARPDGRLSLTPNPTTGNALLQMESPDNAQVTVRLFNSVGQLVASQEWAVEKGFNALTVPTAYQQKGIYYVVVETGTTRWVEKLVRF